MEKSDGRLGLAGRVAVVTGGTRGLGLAIARKLCSGGCDVVLNFAGSPADADRATESLAGLPGAVRAVRGDIRRPAVLDTLRAEAEQWRGGVDIFVHNAASWHPMPAVGADPAGLRTDLTTALAPLLGAAAVLGDQLAARGAGRIVAVSSAGALRPIPRYVSLGVAKAALESAVRYLAVELAGRGVTVNAVSAHKLDKGGPAPDAELAARLAARSPAGRLTRPGDVADVVALLCTDEAAWIQGQVITVDGGFGLLS
ncbi:SDR family oxidoreductase [Micromonospora auratinigra]|uniref:Enoyl-[acyl-carrier-protein] reductase [NADH] n=1 Tax=Micromonospora auratinigra TaxID=261654 RepID=A0A1A8ZGB4_9ACTN|nr:SDR family oxidoreductase [Micromonospora auratinigra]SBT42907.1 Enoyl-[acyl-carrier-protein] reductase [NADH] [Micromonospora auratinigra]